MNFPRIFVTSAVAISVIAAIGCSSTQTTRDTTTTRVIVPVAAPEPIAEADTMPSHPALQNERTEVAVYEAPVVVANDSAINTASANFTERAPRADRN